MVMVNLGSTDDSRYTGYREITDRDVLDLQCITINYNLNEKKKIKPTSSSLVKFISVLQTRFSDSVRFNKSKVSYSLFLMFLNETHRCNVECPPNKVDIPFFLIQFG